MDDEVLKKQAGRKRILRGLPLFFDRARKLVHKRYPDYRASYQLTRTEAPLAECADMFVTFALRESAAYKAPTGDNNL